MQGHISIIREIMLPVPVYIACRRFDVRSQLPVHLLVGDAVEDSAGPLMGLLKTFRVGQGAYSRAIAVAT